MKRILYILLISTFVSCNDFVDIIPKGSVIPSTIDDLGKMLDNTQPGLATTITNYSDAIFVPDEDPFYSIDKVPIESKNAYLWEPHIFAENADDYTWNELYHSIYLCNYVLANIDDAEGGIDYSKEEVKGRALVHRASSYFSLNQIYSNQYTKETAETDLGVPLKLSHDINATSPRSTVAKVYEQMIIDLEAAVELLPERVSDINDEPARPAALGLLARVHLFMGNYEESYDYATQAIALLEKYGDRQIMDYKGITQNVPGKPFFGVSGYPKGREATNSESIYLRKTCRGFGCVSPELIELYGEFDTRKIFLTAPYGSYKYYVDSNVKYRHDGIDIFELYITKAEIDARNGNINGAIETLDFLREKRIATAGFVPTNENDPDKLLKLVLEERRKEYCTSAMRFYDMKRLDKEPKLARDYTRVSQGKTYTLEVNSPFFTLPIPQKIIGLGGYEQNPAPGR